MTWEFYLSRKGDYQTFKMSSSITEQNRNLNQQFEDAFRRAVARCERRKILKERVWECVKACRFGIFLIAVGLLHVTVLAYCSGPSPEQKARFASHVQGHRILSLGESSMFLPYADRTAHLSNVTMAIFQLTRQLIPPSVLAEVVTGNVFAYVSFSGNRGGDVGKDVHPPCPVPLFSFQGFLVNLAVGVLSLVGGVRSLF